MTNDGYGEPVPDSPCEHCTGLSAVTRPNPNPGKPWPTVRGVFTEEYYLTSWEWCKDVGTCGATIDWEKVYNRD